jgi:hypothetical protein
MTSPMPSIESRKCSITVSIIAVASIILVTLNATGVIGDARWLTEVLSTSFGFLIMWNIALRVERKRTAWLRTELDKIIARETTR